MTKYTNKLMAMRSGSQMHDTMFKAVLGVVIVIFVVIVTAAITARPVGVKADDWLRTLFGEVPPYTCADYDTDGDGYISCTARVGEAELVAFECHILTSQCRLQKAVVRGRPW